MRHPYSARRAGKLPRTRERLPERFLIARIDAKRRCRCEAEALLDVDPLWQPGAGALPRSPAEACRSGNSDAAAPTGGRHGGTAALANGRRRGNAMPVSGNRNAAVRLSGKDPGKARAGCTRPLSAETSAAPSIDPPPRCLAAACRPGGTVLDRLFARADTEGLIAWHYGNDCGNEKIGTGVTAASRELANAVVAAAATCGMPLAGKMPEAQSG